MNFTSYLENIDQIKEFKEAGIKELILAPKELSRFGELEINQLPELSRAIKALDLKVILEWDILMTGESFNEALNFLSGIDLDSFYAVRVQDPGALYYLLENHPLIKIQLNLETGNHNLTGIKSWVHLMGKRLDKIILSTELNREKLKSYIGYFKEHDFSFELLGLGKILLFYTPRNLLSNQFPREGDQLIAVGKSEETPHKGFKILENRHGTFMFNPKDLCLLDFLDEIFSFGQVDLRIDFRYYSKIKMITDFGHLPFLDFKEIYLGKYTKGFFQVNKTKSVFSRLKNSKILRKDQGYIGQIIGVRKKEHLAIQLKNNEREITVGDVLEVHTPDGKIKKHKIGFLRDSENMDLLSGRKNQMVLIDHISGVSIKSNVYFG